jgi:hypothetical protein
MHAATCYSPVFVFRISNFVCVCVCLLAVTERVEGSSTSIDPRDHVGTGLILFSLAAAAAATAVWQRTSPFSFFINPRYPLFYWRKETELTKSQFSFPFSVSFPGTLYRFWNRTSSSKEHVIKGENGQSIGFFCLSYWFRHLSNRLQKGI